MERLTKIYENGIVTLDAAAFTETQETIDREIRNFAPAKAAVERLAEFEDAEEKGLLVKLPCKVGDMVYSIHELSHNRRDIVEVEADAFFLMLSVAEKRFGKTVFLTPEAAQQALKARESE